jgi:hypothetical protein
MWCYSEVRVTKVDEGGDDNDGIGDEMHHLDPIEEEEAAEEVTRRESEPALDVREEDGGLVGPLSWELLARRPPADLLKGSRCQLGG